MSVSVGVVGATTHKGRQLVNLLDTHRDFELRSLTTTGGETGVSYGSVADGVQSESLSEATRGLQLSETRPAAIPDDVELLFSALPRAVAERTEPLFLEAGFVVSSTAPNERLASDVPLVVPELNADHLSLLDLQGDRRKWDGALVKAPSFGSAVLSVPLAALGVDRVTAVTVSVLRSASGTHDQAVGSMALLNNVVPHIPGADGRIETEPNKLFGTFDGTTLSTASVGISASANRIPTVGQSLLDVWVSTDDEIEAADAEAAFQAFAGSELPSSPDRPLSVFLESGRPQPRLDAAALSGGRIGVGGVESTPNGIQFHCVAIDTACGSVGTSVRNAELLVDRGYVSR